MRAVVPLERSHQLEGQTPVHVSHPRDNTSLLRLIALLLFLLVAASIYNIVTTYQQNQLAEQRAATYRERVAAVSKVAEEQRKAIQQLRTSYEQDAYDNPRLDRIAEQQLIATEYTLEGLRILGIQNSQIIELMSVTP